MELKDKLLDSFIAFEEDFVLDEELHQKRIDALKIFESKGFPTKKIEGWKYTSLERLLQKDYILFSKSENCID
ncbi:MAG: Fe-S cluster assembly protein SufD, partial [Flavobacteriaceae bacterium]